MNFHGFVQNSSLTGKESEEKLENILQIEQKKTFTYDSAIVIGVRACTLYAVCWGVRIAFLKRFSPKTMGLSGWDALLPLMYLKSNSSKYKKYMPAREMFEVAIRKQTWGIEGYQVPVKHVDPQRQIKDREFSELREKNKLPTKNKNYVTKRGHFYNDLEKMTKHVPGPSKYKIEYTWVSEADKERGKRKGHDTKKSSYIDAIIDEQKKRPIPGPGKYNVSKTDEQIKKEVAELKSKKIKQGEKVDFLQECQVASIQVPGPGQYNPRGIQKKMQGNRTKPEDWIQKHKGEHKRAKSALPDCGTYNPVLSNTFDKVAELNKNGANRPKSNYLGTSVRFDGPEKKSKGQPPGPGQYPMIAKWPGKEDGMVKDSKAKNWMYNLSKGTQEVRSIYY